jgi:hypothetical protein
MKTIFNFSHPLGEKAKEQITKAVGENKVCNIPVHLNLHEKLHPQMLKICHQAVTDHGQPDYIICPGHASAAVIIDRFFSRAEDDYPPITTYRPTIRLVMENSSTPPIFVLAEIWGA